LILIRFDDQKVAAQVVNHLLGGISQERGRDTGPANGAQHHNPGLQMLRQIRNNLFR